MIRLHGSQMLVSYPEIIAGKVEHQPAQLTGFRVSKWKCTDAQRNRACRLHKS